MKKPLIATAVGAIIIFIWSALSWMVLPVHHTTFMHTPSQDVILKNIQENIGESGVYMLPSVDNSNIKMFDAGYQKACQELHEATIGKAAAMIFYSKEMSTENPSTMVIGYSLQFIAVFIVVIFLTLLKDRFTTFFERWTAVMFFAVIVSIEGYLMAWNWMGHPWHYIRGFVIDTYVSFGLCGAWLAWYLGRE